MFYLRKDKKNMKEEKIEYLIIFIRENNTAKFSK